MPAWSTKIDNYAAARCIELAAVFQDQLLEEPLPASAPGVVRRRQLALITTAQAACRECPLFIDCLYRAVVEYDVAGYVAGTTPAQRAQIRRRLDITVEREDFAASPESRVGIARSTTARSYGCGTPIRTRALKRWRSDLDARFQRSSVIYAVSAGSPPHVPPLRSQLSPR